MPPKATRKLSGEVLEGERARDSHRGREKKIERRMNKQKDRQTAEQKGRHRETEYNKLERKPTERQRDRDTAK